MSEELFQRLSRLVDKSTQSFPFKKNKGIGEVILNDQTATGIYGTADEFMQSQKEFENMYYRMLSDPEKLKPGMVNVVDVEHLRKMGKIDLSYFNYQARQELISNYRTKVVKLGDLISNVGFPNIALPEGANDVRVGLMFDINQKMEHPVFSVLNKMIFNVDPMSESISDMTFNTQNIMSSSQIQRNMSQISAIANGSLFTQTSKIATIDIESTGLMFGSQARSVSLIQRTGLDEAAKMVKVAEEGMDFMYDSPRLAGVLASDSQTLSQFIAEQEGFDKLGNIIGNEDEFMERMTKLFGYLSDESEVDFLTGHNIQYDINTLLDTARSMRGYKQNASLNLVVNKFLDRVDNNPNFMIDTLEIGRQYMRNLFQQTEGLSPDDAIARGDRFIKSFFAEETLADISRGGKATYAAMENFIMNTNLLDLIAAEDHAPEVFAKIFEGSHVAETDTIMQDYMLKYIHQGKLDFRNPKTIEPGAKITKEIIDMARLTALKSSAIVPEANISDPRQLSQAALRYIQTDEGLASTSIMIDAQEAKKTFGVDFGADIEKGFIKYDQGSYKIFTGQGSPIELDKVQAKEYLRSVITGAQDTQYDKTINLTPQGAAPSITRRINPFEKQIMSLGLTRRENSNILIAQELIDQIGMPTNISPVDVDSYIHNVGNFYENFADNPRVIGGDSPGTIRGVVGQIRSLMNPSKTPTFSMGFNMNARSSSEILAQYVSHGQTMSGLGMANSILGPTELAFGDMMSRATGGVARERFQTLSTQPKAGVSDSYLSQFRTSMRYGASEEIGDVVSQFGVSHFKFQSSLRIMESQTQSSLGKKLILPYEYFKSIELASDPSIPDMGKALAEGKVNMSLSFIETAIKDDKTNQHTVHNMLNLTWQEGRDDSGLTSKKIAEKLYEDFVETDNYKNIIKEPDSRLRAEIENLKVLFEKKSKESAVAELEALAKRGVVAGFIEDTGVDSPIARLVQNASSMGVDLTRDTGNRILGNVIDDSTDLLRVFFFDETTARATAPAGTTFTRNMNAIARSSLKGANDVAERLAGDNDLLRTALQNIKAGTRKQDISKSVEIYNNIKPHAGLIAMGAAAMAGGYYLFRKKEERDLYNETLERQPLENYNQNSVTNTYTASMTSLPSSRRDPLVTAGVVGNLDRNKIGHTKMGNNKYNHLYGGQ